MATANGTKKLEDDVLSGQEIDVRVVNHGSSLPTAPTNKVPNKGLFLLDDTAIYENTGTEASPTWTSRLAGISTLTANRALESDGSGNVSASSITSTELSLLSGKTGSLLSIGSETSIEPETDDGATIALNDTYVTDDIQLGNAGELILITAVEWKTHSTVDTNGDVRVGIVKVGNKASSSIIDILGEADRHTTIAASTTYKDTLDSPVLIAGGQIIQAYLTNAAGIANQIRTVSVSSANFRFSELSATANNVGVITITWESATTKPYIKIYYKVIS